MRVRKDLYDNECFAWVPDACFEAHCDCYGPNQDCVGDKKRLAEVFGRVAALVCVAGHFLQFAALHGGLLSLIDNRFTVRSFSRRLCLPCLS